MNTATTVPAGATPETTTRADAPGDDVRQRALEQMAHVAGGGVVVVDARGTVLLRSEGIGDFIGQPDGFEAAWKPLNERIEAELRARPDSAGEFTLELLPGSAPQGGYLHVRVLRLCAAPSGGYVALFARRGALESLQEHLLLASQMRRMHATYRHAAHDLRAPLNAIALNLELIGQDVSGVADRETLHGSQQRVELLRREVARLSRMLQGLLSQSEPPRSEPRTFGVRRLLREVVELVTPQADRLGIRIALSMPGERLAVLAPRDHLKQAILNLLMNALEAMPRGGPIDIELRADGKLAIILIRDHGVGLPSGSLDRIFTLHFTTKPGGSGIGLYTTRAAIEAMGGVLALQSRDGAGTTASIELPLSMDEAVQQASPQVPCSTS
jgi:signal transduction histidine kinase